VALGFGFLACSVDYSFARVPCLVVFVCMDGLPVFKLACTLDYIFRLLILHLNPQTFCLRDVRDSYLVSSLICV